MKRHKIYLIAFLLFSISAMMLMGCTKKIDFKIYFNSNGGTEVVAISTQGEESITMPQNPTKENYIFDNWYWDNETFLNPFTVNSFLNEPLHGDITVYAKWIEIIYPSTITFNSNGGSSVSAITQDVGTTVVAPVYPTKDGYTFAGWYSDEGLNNIYTFSNMPENNITVYARWTVIIQSTITFNSNGGSSVSVITQVVGTTVVAPTDPTRDGCIFAGWYNSIQSVDIYTFNTMPDNDIILYADWETSGLSFNLYESTCYSVSKGSSNTTATVIIPKQYNGKLITSIANSAFYSCTDLTSITIPSSMTIIGSYAFSNCTGLTNITIPSSMISIGASAFSNCNSLTSITIPSSVTSIGASAFNNCNSLINITVEENNVNYSSDNDVLFNFNKSTLISYPKGKVATSYVVPESVITIDNYAFAYCSNLTHISINDAANSIGSYAFSNCTGLTNITIPDTVTNLVDYTFLNCTNLSTITLSNNLTSIGQGVFQSCNSLLNITTPEGLISIGNSAFHSCSSLSNVILASTLTDIASGAFRYCISLTTINIPEGVVAISDWTFAESGLTSITIPSTVVNLGWGSFYGCANLSIVNIMRRSAQSATTGGIDMFTDCNSILKIYVPDAASITAYKAASYWSGYSSKIYVKP